MIETGFSQEFDYWVVLETPFSIVEVFQSKGVFNIVLFSNISKACCSVGDSKFGFNFERVPYDSICQKRSICLDNDSLTL